jgi:hypothetical protein
MHEIYGYRHRGVQAIQQLIEHAPSSGGLALWMAHEDVHADQHAPPVTCDGVKIYYRASFEYLTIRQQMGLVAHEVLHVALRHAQRFSGLQERLGDVDLQLFNICADAVVNSALAQSSWLELPAGSVFLDRLLMDVLGIRQEAGAALREWDVERLYRAIDDRVPPRSPGVKTRQGRNGGRDKGETQRKDSRHPTAGGHDTDQFSHRDGPLSARTREIGARIHRDLIAPAAGNTGPEESETEEAQAWINRVGQACDADGECSIMRGLIADFRVPHTPWEHVLRTRLARALAPKCSISWSRPARSYIANQGRAHAGRRLPWEPGTSQSALVPRVALVIDVSGSIDEQLLKQFTQEIEAIVRRQAAGLILIIGDDRVRKTVVFKSGRATLDNLEFAGGGGTDFSPLLAEAIRHHPDIGIIFTDLDGPAGSSPPFPVVWAVPAARGQSVPPFGRLLVLD